MRSATAPARSRSPSIAPAGLPGSGSAMTATACRPSSRPKPASHFSRPSRPAGRRGWVWPSSARSRPGMAAVSPSTAHRGLGPESRSFSPLAKERRSMARILVVDDDELVRVSVAGILSRAGHQVETAEDGEAALGRHRAARFDLVVTDIVMPRMEGLETVRALRGDRSRVKIVAISGCERRGSEFYLTAARALGADQVLVKPFTGAELRAAVDRALYLPAAVS